MQPGASEKDKINCLITGGSGFLGQRIVKYLIESRNYNVIIFDIQEPPREFDEYKSKVTYIKGDLTNLVQVRNAFKNVDLVMHVATMAISGENTLALEKMHKVNVIGTKNVIESCITNKVPKLIYTSSASVVFDGTDILGKNEDDLPYSSRPQDAYMETKIIGEKLVLEANGYGGFLATCALRPSAIFGEGDALLVPTLVSQAKKGKMKYVIGDGENLMDFTFVDNVAQAHLQAAEKLTLDSPLAKRAYFITNQESVKFWTFSGDILEGLGYDRPHIKLPYMLILMLVMIFQYLIVPILKVFKVDLKSDFTVTRIKLCSKNRSFNTNKAKEDFGYIPKVSMKEALKRTIEAFEHLRNPMSKKSD